ncbi:PIG-L family deacetylase [Patescibacteria group bacterium]|nr:PIG-L family deacetylase [Patescibacteria group bacterium]MBU1499833.1 PIG-L family deacetylase [Patescibacteria group bacterium]
MNILLLVAHPDDETIMCGATIDKLVHNQHKVYVSFYTKNEQAYFGKEKQQSRVKRTVKEAELSSKLLGFKYNFLGFKDMDLAKDKGLLIRATIKEIRRVKPDIIITHNLNDKHIDHKTLAEIVPEANFQSGCCLCGGHEIWKAEIVLKGEVNLEMTSSFSFDFISSVSAKNITKKIKAFNGYESVKNEHQTTQAWLLEKIKITAKLRGATIGNEYGEAFCLNNYSPISGTSTKLLSQFLEQ